MDGNDQLKMTDQKLIGVYTKMKKSAITSDIKALIKDAKIPRAGGPPGYYQGYLKACDDVLKAVENTNQPKQRFPSRELKLIK